MKQINAVPSVFSYMLNRYGYLNFEPVFFQTRFVRSPCTMLIFLGGYHHVKNQKLCIIYDFQRY